jgi:hypothetical protein
MLVTRNRRVRIGEVPPFNAMMNLGNGTLAKYVSFNRGQEGMGFIFRLGVAGPEAEKKDLDPYFA